MITYKRTDSANEDFISLVEMLDDTLRILDGDEPVGCGAIREYLPGIMEIKRMYVLPAKRRQGIAEQILKQLEDWCRQMGYKKTILETGKKQPEAIALYKKAGYRPIPNYGKYNGVVNSVCFEKKL